MDRDLSAQLVDHVLTAIDQRVPLRIVGGNTKSFYAPSLNARGNVLALTDHCGVIAYEPRELVITARAGTPLSEIEGVLQRHNQMLPFEPPHFGANATLGGTIACNLSGPRRAYAGAARDYVLGVEMINGRGEKLRFGGQVMKNVAGYDVSRLMTGAFGTLGVLLNVTLKVLPRPAATLTLKQDCNVDAALTIMNRWAGQPLPITATAHDGNSLFVRLEGADSGVRAARQKVGGDVVDDAHYWSELREQRHGFFDDQRPSWRISVPSTTPALPVTGKTLIEWGGALRWLYTDETPAAVRSAAQRSGGHAICVRNVNAETSTFTPLPSAMLALHRRIKDAFDPHGLFNPGRFYPEL